MIDLILDKCLNDIRAGRATPAECLAKYPEHAAELAPLLELGSALNQLADVKPSSAFQQATRARLMQLPQQPIRPQRRAWLPSLLAMPQMRLAAIALVLVIALVGFTGSAVTASAESLPGSWLYPVKRASEQVQLLLATDSTSQANVHLQIANDRLNESVALAQSGQDQVAQQTLDEYNAEINRTLEIIAQSKNNPASVDALSKVLIKQQEKLHEIKNPRAQEQLLKRALSISEKALERIATPTSQPSLTMPEPSATPVLPSGMTTPATQVPETQVSVPPQGTPPAQVTDTHPGQPVDKGKPSDEPKSTTAPGQDPSLPPGKEKQTEEPKGKPTPKK